MPVAQAATPEPDAAMPSDSERLVDQLANRIGGLGVELADVAGNLREVAGRVLSQSERFGHLQKTAETMVSANHDIAGASRAVQSATTAAVDEITQSRNAVETAVQHIAELIEAVGRIEPPRRGRDRAGAGRQGIRLDRGDRQADQPAGAERHHRGRPRRRGGKRLCGGRQRGEEPRRSDAPGDAVDRRYRSRSRRPGRQPDRRERRRLAAGQERRRRRRADPGHHRPRAGRLYRGRPRDRRRREGGHLQSRPLRHGDRRTRQPRQGRRSVVDRSEAGRRQGRQAARPIRGADRADRRQRRGNLGCAADPRRDRDRRTNLRRRSRARSSAARSASIN